MELAALIVLGGAGFLLARQTAPAPVYPTKAAGANPVARSAINRKEGFANQNQNQVNLRTSLRGSNPQLDLMYNGAMGGQPFPAQPNPSKYLSGSVSADLARAPPVGDWQPSPTGIVSATSDVMMNPAGLEETPSYMEGDSLVSALSGQKMKSGDFVHNNMQPFFGSRVRQNVDAQGNTGVLDRYTGAGSTDIVKKEVESMFDTTQQPFGNVYGMEIASDFVQSRINDPRNRAGERPFEPVQVAPGVGEGFSSTGKGGFQQIEVNDLMMKNMRRTDDLRTANNPKLSYKTPVVPGQQFIGKSMDTPGEVRKYRPDTFVVNESAERFGPGGQGAFLKESSRPMQVLPQTTRPETSVEYMGPSASQDFGLNYVVGSYRQPTGSQFGGAGYRNADGSAYFAQGSSDDYGREGFEVRPNERSFTSDRVMGLNLSPAEAGAVATHYDDESRPTRRGETIGNIQQAGVATGYAAGAPAITVWDPNDIARTTVKEGLIHLDRFGVAAPADAPTRLKVYDPADIARPTQKAQISAKSSYVGGPKAAHERFTSHQAAYNMRLNPNKQQVAKGRSVAGGNIQIFRGDEPNVSSRKLDTDVINDRAPAVNRPIDLGPGSADIGRVKYRSPLKLDVQTERNQREIIAQTENNPLMQSLQRNAEHDSRLATQLYRAMSEVDANA